VSSSDFVPGDKRPSRLQGNLDRGEVTPLPRNSRVKTVSYRKRISAINGHVNHAFIFITYFFTFKTYTSKSGDPHSHIIHGNSGL
jgi:hypothetical protein